jgi:serine/threonine protein kinase
VLHQIGAGTLGPVFRAYDADRERLVAVKLFTLDLPPERGHQLASEFERLIAAELTHPALAAPLATGIHGVSAYLVQEYVAAESLDLAVREYGPAPAADALRVAAQLAGALDFAAAVNITHGALHPRDILLSADDTRLTGIGITRALERVGVAAPVRRPYTSPERVAGAEWDRRADVFSLAALMHELLWARRITGLGAQAADGLTEIPGADVTALRAVFARALAEKATDRYATALDFAQALKNAFAEETAGALPSPTPASRRRTPRPMPKTKLPLLEPPSPVTNQAADSDAHDPALGLVHEAAGDVTHRTADDLVPEPADDIARPVEAGEQPFESDLALSIADAQEERYRDVEAAPAIVEPAMVEPPVAHAEMRPPAEPFAAIVERPETVSPIDRSRSATWPLVLALLVGLMIGFASGYGVGTRERTAAPEATAARAPATPPPSPAPAGREFTETAVPARPVAPPAKTPEPGSNKPDVRSSAVETEGRLLVRSTPAGALVLVDGKEYGRTPAVVRDLARGAHRVRVLREGYTTEERTLTITSARPSQSMTVLLTRPAASSAAARGARPAPPIPSTPGTIGRFVGGLTVVSRPPGANVFVDGKMVGTTPISLPAVAAGSHVVRLDHDGYRRWTSSVRVVASEQNRVTASLER